MSLATLVNLAAGITLDAAFNPNVGDFERIKVTDNSTDEITGEFAMGSLRGDMQMDREGNRQVLEATIRVLTSTVLSPNDRITRDDKVWFVEGPVSDDGRQVVYGLSSKRRDTIGRVHGSMTPPLPRRR